MRRRRDHQCLDGAAILHASCRSRHGDQGRAHVDDEGAQGINGKRRLRARRHVAPMMMDPIISPIILGGLGSAGISTIIGISAAEILAHVLSFVIVAGVAVGLYLLTAPSLPKPED